ncbi:MAG TPA: OmpA family protein [Accumulibacter sp.]|nr:OmpA family protein [Accumulibacter sp.]HMW16824.1 OmpA family protein [Accumulibacter sp.]HMX21659.1 OmpA family protein [Accumulibacter sp.]HMY05738.1 OmpA family protein [Accumulibacter sp.]HNC17071.1 OmpA family protein [Accumulibacter sp.]
MLLNRPYYRLLLIFALLLSACATGDKPLGVDGAGKANAPEKSARGDLGRASRDKSTPFADVVEKRTVYFSLAGVAIDSEGHERLRENALKLKEDPQLIVTLVGHTDNLGSVAYNLAVADRRIDAVSDRLRALGVPRSQIRRMPLGSEESSKLKCDVESCRRLMRKVELVYERR